MKLKSIKKLKEKRMTLDIEVDKTHTYQLVNGWITHNTSSLILESASGIHPHHSYNYFRRVQCNKLEVVYKYFKTHNSHMCEESKWSANKTDEIVTFPITVSGKSLIKNHLTAIKHLKIIKKVQENWVLAGTSSDNKKPITHNVSCTVIVKENEWEKVIDFIFDNKDYFGAVALIADTGDKDYIQSPLEAIVTKEDKEKFSYLVQNYNVVDYKNLKEHEDNTELAKEISCGGGKCELPIKH